MKNLSAEQLEIWNCMKDEDSKLIYEQRIEYLNTLDSERYTSILLENTNSMKAWIQKAWDVCISSQKKLVVYGVGHDYKILKPILDKQNKNYALCDQNEELWGKELEGREVLSPAEILDSNGEYSIFICSTKYGEEIKSNFIDKGYPKELVVSLLDAQYFDVFPCVSEEDVFVDAGCFNGGTIENFCKWSNGKYKKIFAFEPDDQSYPICVDTIQKNAIKNVEMIKKGTWSEEKTLYMHLDGESSKICDNGECSIEVIDIDSVTKGERVSFIKMDVEGSELESLIGAQNTIVKYRPKLAICVYHKVDDILTIPAYIHRIVPEYRFYLRQYNLNMAETVLYAVVE